MLLMIDNYDSFTFNLVQYLGELGQEVKVVRNDALDVAGIRALKPSHIMISPGPGTPDDAGVSLALIEQLGGAGADLRRVPGPPGDRPGLRRQGGPRQADHARQDLAGAPPRPGRVRRPAGPVRGHALPFAGGGSRTSLPDCLEVTAWTEHPDGSLDEIMGLRHKTLPVEGVQFHPESILTQHGHDLLRNFLGLAAAEGRPDIEREFTIMPFTAQRGAATHHRASRDLPRRDDRPDAPDHGAARSAR